MSWKLHQIVKAKVTELQSDDSLVVSFEGKLLRLQNHSDQSFRLGQSVYLEVIALRPVRFRLSSSVKNNGFRVSI